jgi:hypothetical protein
MIFVTHQTLQQSVSWGDDITRLVTSSDLTSWSKDNSLSTPVNVAGILDLCTATNIHGQGIFVLYKTSNGASKIYGEFMKLDPQADTETMMQWASEVQCPKGNHLPHMIYSHKHILTLPRHPVYRNLPR